MEFRAAALEDLPQGGCKLAEVNGTRVVLARRWHHVAHYFPGITVFGTDYPTPDGTPICDYIHIADLVSAHLLVLDALARGNQEYEQKFGYIFIVCATGKSAAEMLALLETRLPNDPGEEIRIAAEEQMKITRLRLEKLLGAGS